MDRHGTAGEWEAGGGDGSIGSLVELIVTASDDSDDHWEIADRVEAAVRAGGIQRIA